MEPEGRLLRPRIADRDASWDEALDLIATRFAEAMALHGPDSLAIYASGQLLTEDYYVANKLMKGFIGSANIDTNSRLCMASAVVAHKRAFGSDTVPGTYEDLEQADLVVLVGSNLAWCHPVLNQRLIEAKAARPELTIVNIDPRRTATCALSDLHLPLKPGSDLALFNGLLQAINREDAVDRDYVESHTSGLSDALAAAGAVSEAEIAEITGLSPRVLRDFYDLWIKTERVVTLFSQGVNQSVNGTDKGNAIINCHLASGRIGREGMGPFSITGQPNAMGGREVGGLASILAAHLDLENTEHRKAVQRFWNAPRMAERPGLKAVDLFHACADGRIKALWILSTNPVDSMPEADRVRAAIEACPFVVLSDVQADTDTARVADVLLPAAAWGEKSGSVTNADRTISRQRAFRQPPGEARPDWRMLADVAIRLGWEAAFAFENPAAVFREHAALSGIAGRLGRDFDISDLAEIDDEAYEALEPFRWPRAKGRSGGRFFAEGGFYTKDNRAHIVPTAWRPCLPATTEQWPLRLLTGRIRDHWHTMTRTGLAPHLSRRHPEPVIEIHPTDAARYGVKDDELASLGSPMAQAVLRVRVTTDTPEGCLFAPIHWSEHYAAKARIAALIPPDCDPLSGQPAYKATPVRIARFPVDWWGIAAAEAQFQPESDYWALARVAGGWAATLAGKDWAEVSPASLGLSAGDNLITVEVDPDCRFNVLTRDERISAAFLWRRTRPKVTAAQLATRIGRVADLDQLKSWFDEACKTVPNPIVCACFSIGEAKIRAAIATEKLNTVEQLGRALRAGTNCGTCKPELVDLLNPSSS